MPVHPLTAQCVPFEASARAIVADAGTSAVYDSPAQLNDGWRGVRLSLNVSAVLGASPTLDVKIQVQDQVSKEWNDLPGAAFSQKTGAGNSDLIIYPGIAETANVSVSDTLSGVWRALATIAGTALTADSVTLTSDATAPDDGGTFVLGANTYTAKTALTEVKASSELVGDGSVAANNSIITIGDVVYTYKTALSQVRASVTLTSDATNPDDGGTLTLGYGQYLTVYTLKTTLGTTQNQIKIGATAAITLDNIKAAINASGTAGVEYSAVMQHPQIEATTNTDTTQLFQGRIGSGYEFQLGNVLQSGENATHLSFDSSLFVGGVDPVAYEVLIGADDDGCLANLDAAIKASGTAGTEYSTGTEAHPFVTSSVVTNTLTVTALEVGVAANDLDTLASTSPDSHQDWADTTLGGGTGNSTPGVDSIANEVLIGASAAAFLDNVKSAINGTAGEGTTYSTGTVAHPLIEATTNTDTTQLFVSRSGVSHTVADALASTTPTLTHTTFGATTLGGGNDAATFTFSLGGTLLP